LTGAQPSLFLPLHPFLSLSFLFFLSRTTLLFSSSSGLLLQAFSFLFFQFSFLIFFSSASASHLLPFLFCSEQRDEEAQVMRKWRPGCRRCGP
jgi:hypothetical protein